MFYWFTLLFSYFQVLWGSTSSVVDLGSPGVSANSTTIPPHLQAGPPGLIRPRSVLPCPMVLVVLWGTKSRIVLKTCRLKIHFDPQVLSSILRPIVFFYLLSHNILLYLLLLFDFLAIKVHLYLDSLWLKFIIYSRSGSKYFKRSCVFHLLFYWIFLCSIFNMPFKFLLISSWLAELPVLIRVTVEFSHLFIYLFI